MNAAQQTYDTSRPATAIEDDLNIKGFIHWARDNLVPNELKSMLLFNSGGYRELSNLIPISDERGRRMDGILTEWWRSEKNPDAALKVMQGLYQFGMGPTTVARVFRLHRNTVTAYRKDAMNYLWQRRDRLVENRRVTAQKA